MDFKHNYFIEMDLKLMLNKPEIPSRENSFNNVECFNGYIHDMKDALLILEGVKRKIIKIMSRRLNNYERKQIRSGSIFIFEESKGGVQRWTDPYSWSTSRLKDNFLIYNQKVVLGDPLIKKTISVITLDKKRLSIINYYYESDIQNNILTRPSNISIFDDYIIPINFYFKCVTTNKSKGNRPVGLIPLNVESYESPINSLALNNRPTCTSNSTDIQYSLSSFFHSNVNPSSLCLPSIHFLLNNPNFSC